MAPPVGEVVRRLLRLARPLGGWMALGVFLGFLTVGSGVGLMMTSAWLIARAALHPPVGDLQVAIVGVRFFGIARAVLRYLERLVSHDAALRVLAGMRLWFYRRLEPLAPARLWMRPSADLLARLVADVESLESFYVRGLRPPLVAAATVALMGLVLGAVDGRVALVAAALMVGSGAAVPWATARLRRHLGALIVLARSDLRVRLLDQVQGLADLLACGRAAAHQEGVEACGRRLAGLQRRLALVGALHEALMGLAASAAAAAALVLAIPRVRSGELEAVLVPAAVLGILAAFEAILPLPEAAAQMEETAAAAGRLLEIVDAEPEVAAELEEPPAVPVRLPPGPLALRLLEVSFHYPGPGNPAALSRVSLEVPAGGRVAVVGPSGAGKSTLVQLLLRFWECQSGRLEVGGTDLRRIPLQQLRACFGVVPQRTHLFAGTVRQNLLLARPDAPPEALEAACRAARLHEVVQALPQGYDTWLGDRGYLLSGGERQRLAVARALLRQAPVLLLDEATAHLDGRTEAELLEDVLGLAWAHTLLVITHRLAGLERMDRIYFLERGSAAESGTHTELLARPGGRYRRFYDLERQGAVIA